MQIEVYSNFKKNINSIKIPSSGATINVALKSPTSEKTPTFILNNFDLSWNYIKWGDVYYFVEDIIIINNNQAEYHCVKDVMATFRNDILSSVQLVSRNANKYQPQLADKLYPALNKSILTRSEVSTWDVSFSSSGCYVVGIINPDAQGGVAYYEFLPANFSNFMA